MARHPASFRSVSAHLTARFVSHADRLGSPLRVARLPRGLHPCRSRPATQAPRPSWVMIVLGCLPLLSACDASDWDRHELTGPDANRLISSVEIKPSGAIIAPDEVGEFRAEVKSGRGTTVSRNVTWRSSDASVIQVDASGQVVAVNEGTATLEATHQGVSGSVTVDVKGKVVSIRLNQSSVVLAEGEREQLQATYIYENGAERPAKRVQWRSGDPQILDVDSDGLARGIYEGETWIYIQGRGHELSTDALVRGARVAEVEIGAPRSRIEEGESVQFWADVWDEGGNRLSRPVQWSTSNAAVASVDQEGRVTGRSSGQATITASSGGESDSETIEVVTVSSTSSSDSEGGDSEGGDSESSMEEGRPGEVKDLQVVSAGETSASLRFTQVDDGTGNPAKYDVRYSQKPITWGSATSVAKGTCKVPLSGTAIGQALSCTVEGLQPSTAYEFQLVAYRGTLNEDAVFGSLSNIAGGTTDDAPISVEVLPSGVTLEEDEGKQLTATVTDAYGNELDESVSWSSTRTSVATVSSAGYVKAVASGDTEIRATADGVTGSSQVQVTAIEEETSLSSDDAPSQCTNEPSGFVAIESQPWNEKPPTGGWGASSSVEHRMTTHSDGSAPSSPSRVLRGIFPEGFEGGNAPFSTGYQLEGSNRFPRVYVCQWTKHSSNFVNHPTGSKHLWFMLEGVSAWNGATSVYSAHDGSNMRVQINLQNQPWGNRNLTPNRGTNQYIQDFLGKWVKYEYLLELNRDGAYDGRVRVWINGDLILSYDDVKFLESGDPRYFTRVRWQPTYGGVDHEVPNEQYQDMDHIYISGGS